jgi:V/A-type H+-transporting ATPase subunit D
MPIRVPPGRTGRLWLRERLVIAGRAADLLEQKRQALLQETSRLRQLVEDTRDRWEAACGEADQWLLRAALVGGERQFEVAAAHLGQASEARVVWRSTMGLAYPSEADCLLGPAVGLAGFGDASALGYAVEAHRVALAVAVEYASAERALELVASELEVTTRRLRAIDRRWVPRLGAALHEVEQRLEEQEREAVIWAHLAARPGWDGGR